MDLLLIKRLSILTLVAVLVISVSTAGSTNPVPGQEVEEAIPGQEVEENKNETFTVDVTLYGVDNITDNVVTFVNINNITRGIVLNATHTDLNDTSKNDGIVDVFLAFPNVTISAGEEFRACNMLLSDLSLVCDTGHNSPSPRTEYIDLLLQPNEEEQ